MRDGASIAVIIPALNEELSIGNVLSAIPRWVDDVIVVDNGSTDKTAEVARSHGARVILEPRRGYGSACLAGIAALNRPEVVVFLDGDFSDFPEEMGFLVDPILSGQMDMIIGSRVLGRREAGALTPQARFGNLLACALMRLFFKISYTDLGPFRAIRYDALKSLNLCDRNYGWTVEMQVKAAQAGLRIGERPVGYRRRIGKSKVSGTVKGVVAAGTKILLTIFVSAITSGSRKAVETFPNRLILFTRYPEPGKTKTRLFPVLGPEGSADLQRRMTEHVINRLKPLRWRRRISIGICYEGGSERSMREWLGPCFAYEPQAGGDLGERMAESFRKAFAEGAEKVLLVGSDCPGLTAEIAEKAFRALSRNDVVLGPATDGGYYLIGLKRLIPQLFAAISWGSAEVLKQTVKIADEVGLTTELVDTLADVDRPEDLPIWENEEKTGAASSAPPRISVIIPAFNEAPAICAALESAQSDLTAEIIVADAASADATCELARSHGAVVVKTLAGRARQMNAGAAAANGDIFIFLHADTRLPDGFGETVRNALSKSGVVAGAFQLRIASSMPALRAIERAANWRAKYLQMPYGDQALFLGADLFHSLGGFPEIPIMEDFEFVRRLRAKGRIEIIPSPVLTSPRRWLTLGVWRTTLINHALVAAYYAGFSIAHIARWYHPDREFSNQE